MGAEMRRALVGLAILALLAACGGDDDGGGVPTFRELAEERGLDFRGLKDDADVTRYAERVCDDLDADSESFFLATMHDTSGPASAEEGAAAHATAVDAFCPDERSDLEEGVRSYERLSGRDVDLPTAP